MRLFPEITPLNARITGTIEKNVYRVENIICKSIPGFYVKASIFTPEDVDKLAPIILFCYGHNYDVYRPQSYQ
jgi:hypothetical protein